MVGRVFIIAVRDGDMPARSRCFEAYARFPILLIPRGFDRRRTRMLGVALSSVRRKVMPFSSFGVSGEGCSRVPRPTNRITVRGAMQSSKTWSNSF